MGPANGKSQVKRIRRCEFEASLVSCFLQLSGVGDGEGSGEGVVLFGLLARLVLISPSSPGLFD